jgi:hypothetical protein
VIPYPGGAVGNLKNTSLPDLQSMTEITSHELAEAVTDGWGPHGDANSYGWQDRDFAAANPQLGGEIGDIVEQMADRTVYLNGYAVQKLADMNDNPMLPAGATDPAWAVPPDLTGRMFFFGTGYLLINWELAPGATRTFGGTLFSEYGTALIDVVGQLTYQSPGVTTFWSQGWGNSWLNSSYMDWASFSGTIQGTGAYDTLSGTGTVYDPWYGYHGWNAQSQDF